MGKSIRLKNDIYIANELFSTNERVVGKFLDGKNLYNKTLNLGLVGTRTSVNIGNNYKFITKHDAYMTKGNEYQSLPRDYALNDFNFTLRYDIVDSNLTISFDRKNNSNWSDWNLYVTLEYTKVND